MRTKALFFVMAFLLVFTAVAPILAQDQPVASVNTAYLNIRSGPGLGYGTIATVPRGYGLLLLGRNAEYNWVLVGMTNGTQGWVNVNYVYTVTSISSLPLAESAAGEPIAGTPLQPAATITGYVVAQLLAGPNEANPVVASAANGTTVYLVGRNFDASWALVRLADGTQGWVPAGAVTSTVPVRALSPADGSVYAPPAPHQLRNLRDPTRRHAVWHRAALRRQRICTGSAEWHLQHQRDLLRDDAAHPQCVNWVEPMILV